MQLHHLHEAGRCMSRYVPHVACNGIWTCMSPFQASCDDEEVDMLNRESGKLVLHSALPIPPIPREGPWLCSEMGIKCACTFVPCVACTLSCQYFAIHRARSQLRRVHPRTRSVLRRFGSGECGSIGKMRHVRCFLATSVASCYDYRERP